MSLIGGCIKFELAWQPPPATSALRLLMKEALNVALATEHRHDTDWRHIPASVSLTGHSAQCCKPLVKFALKAIGKIYAALCYLPPNVIEVILRHIGNIVRTPDLAR